MIPKSKILFTKWTLETSESQTSKLQINQQIKRQNIKIINCHSHCGSSSQICLHLIYLDEGTALKFPGFCCIFKLLFERACGLYVFLVSKRFAGSIPAEDTNPLWVFLRKNICSETLPDQTYGATLCDKQAAESNGFFSTCWSYDIFSMLLQDHHCNSKNIML